MRYKEFLRLVATAAGPFGYIFDGQRFICDPPLYVARNWSGDWERMRRAAR
jgi:hypothetical protein